MRLSYYILTCITGYIISYYLKLVPYKKECLGVGPGGFSGFWYTLKKLKEDNYNGEYVCASSGCLSVVTKDFSLNDIYKMTKTNGNFSYIKNRFIHLVVKKIDKIPDMTIITMNKWLTCNFRKPRTKHELETLLIITTDVPFISNRISTEIDGGACFYLYSNCNKNILVPKHSRFIMKILNPNMTIDDLVYFYNFI